MSKNIKRSILAALIATSVLLASCAGADNGSAVKGGAVSLQGAGATFPYPLYSKWFNEYHKMNPNVKIDYQSIGSGGGIKQITEQTVDFGASDAPMTDAQMKDLKKPILHIPTVLGAVVVTYNLPSVQGELKLSSESIAGIFLGEIKKWNDAKIASLNPDLKLPDKEIVLVHRSDGSGTTAIFVDYLSKVSPVWSEKVGKGTSVNWPAGIGGKGNEGVTGQVKQLEGAIGYVELIYALQNKLPYASIVNQAGKAVAPTLEAVTAAAAGFAAEMPEDLRISITNAPGDAAYPIAGYTYLLIYQGMGNAEKAETLTKFLSWGLHDGQQLAKELGYAPLPADIVTKADGKVKLIASNAGATH